MLMPQSMVVGKLAVLCTAMHPLYTFLEPVKCRMLCLAACVHPLMPFLSVAGSNRFPITAHSTLSMSLDWTDCMILDPCWSQHQHYPLFVITKTVILIHISQQNTRFYFICRGLHHLLDITVRKKMLNDFPLNAWESYTFLGLVCHDEIKQYFSLSFIYSFQLLF